MSMSQLRPFDAQGRLICWECNGLTVACVSGSGGAPENYGKTFYKCELKPQPGCKKFFRWQSQVDVLREIHRVPDPDAPQGQETASSALPTTTTTTTTTTAALTRSSSQPTQTRTESTENLTQLSSSQPVPATSGRVRPPIDLHAPPVVTPQRHLSRQNTLDVAAADPPTTTVLTTPRRGRSHAEPEAEAVIMMDAVETVATDDEYERVISPRPVERTPTRSSGRVYPALPPSTSRRARERMPGTYTSSSDASGPTIPASERRVHEWLHSPSMPERRDDVFMAASPMPTQDTPPSLAPSLAPSSTSPSRGASTASRMHGLLRESSPSPSQGTVRTARLSEPDAPMDAARVADEVLRLGREAARVRELEARILELERQNEELLDERRDMRALLSKMEHRLEALRKRRGA